MPDGTEPVEKKRKSLLRRVFARAIDALIPSDEQAARRGQWIEQKFHSILLSLATVAIIWAAGKLTTIDTMVSQIAELRVQLDGTYRADVAQRDMQDLRRRIDAGDQRDQQYDQRLDSVERRMDRVEFVLDSAPGTQRLLRRAQDAAAIDKAHP